VCRAARATLPALLLVPHSFGQTPQTPAQNPVGGTSPACASPEHRQLDFWAGEWQVRDPGGGVVGMSRVDRVLEGCALHELWKGVPADSSPPVVGRSYSAYDAWSHRWHQLYVDNFGGLLRLEGVKQGNSLVLSGKRLGRDGVERLYRIAWTPQGSSEVRQLFEVSADQGATWQTLFDGRYRRR
jgi:hypothetical protein